MSNQLQRHLGLAALLTAGGIIGLAFVLADEAVAGPGDDPYAEPPLEVTPVHKPGVDEVPPPPTDLEPFPVTRLSVPIETENGAVDHGGPSPEPAAVAYIFVNMDGDNLVCGNGDNAVTNSSIIACQYGFTGQYPSYGGTDAQRQSVIDAVKQDWSPFNAVITTARPNSAPYTMCMTGPANHPFGNGVLGIAPLDCNDGMPNNIVFAFHSASQLGGFLGANVQATTISQEVAHAYGLEHVGSSADIMNPTNQGGNPAFTDTCIGLVSNGQPILCSSQHNQFCANGQQNSYQELLNMWGASNPDDEPPSVVVSYPYDGDAFEIGADFTITCEASDNENVASVQLWIDGAQMGGTKTAAPYSWEVTNIPEGQYDIYCVAADDWDNSAMSPVVSISVEEGGMPGDSGGDSGSGSGGDSGSGSGGDSGTTFPDSGGLPPGFGLDDADSGCACDSDGPDRPAWMLLALLGLPLLRRRPD